MKLTPEIRKLYGFRELIFLDEIVLSLCRCNMCRDKDEWNKIRTAVLWFLLLRAIFEWVEFYPAIC